MPHILPEQSADTAAPTASPPCNCSGLGYLYSPNSYRLLCSPFFFTLNSTLCAQIAGLIFLLLPLLPRQDLVSFPSELEFSSFHMPFAQERGILFYHGSGKQTVFI